MTPQSHKVTINLSDMATRQIHQGILLSIIISFTMLGHTWPHLANVRVLDITSIQVTISFRSPQIKYLIDIPKALASSEGHHVIEVKFPLTRCILPWTLCVRTGNFQAKKKSGIKFDLSLRRKQHFVNFPLNKMCWQKYTFNLIILNEKNHLFF